MHGRASALLFSLLIASTSYAAVKEYQVRRLISMDSSCNPINLTQRPGQSETLLFHADCRNLSHYPDGIDVKCDNPRNERSCRILTRPKSFDNLKLLQGSST